MVLVPSTMKCPACGGSGISSGTICARCAGSGISAPYRKEPKTKEEKRQKGGCGCGCLPLFIFFAILLIAAWFTSLSDLDKKKIFGDGPPHERFVQSRSIVMEGARWD